MQLQRRLCWLYNIQIFELLFGFVEAVFVAPRSEELAIAK